MTAVMAWLWQALGGRKLEEEMEHFKHENGTKANHTEEILRRLYLFFSRSWDRASLIYIQA